MTHRDRSVSLSEERAEVSDFVAVPSAEDVGRLDVAVCNALSGTHLAARVGHRTRDLFQEVPQLSLCAELVFSQPVRNLLLEGSLQKLQHVIDEELPIDCLKLHIQDVTGVGMLDSRLSHCGIDGLRNALFVVCLREAEGVKLEDHFEVVSGRTDPFEQFHVCPFVLVENIPLVKLILLHIFIDISRKVLQVQNPGSDFFKLTSLRNTYRFSKSPTETVRKSVSTVYMERTARQFDYLPDLSLVFA